MILNAAETQTQPPKKTWVKIPKLLFPFFKRLGEVITNSFYRIIFLNLKLGWQKTSPGRPWKCVTWHLVPSERIKILKTSFSSPVAKRLLQKRHWLGNMRWTKISKGYKARDVLLTTTHISDQTADLIRQVTKLKEPAVRETQRVIWQAV